MGRRRYIFGEGNGLAELGRERSEKKRYPLSWSWRNVEEEEGGQGRWREKKKHGRMVGS